MSHCSRCNLDPAPSPPAFSPSRVMGPSRTRVSRLASPLLRGVQWIVPAGLLVLMPKCPMCVVGYVAFFTGVGITIPTARWIQVGMPVLCVATLVCLALRFWFRRASRAS